MYGLEQVNALRWVGQKRTRLSLQDDVYRHILSYVRTSYELHLQRALLPSYCDDTQWSMPRTGAPWVLQRISYDDVDDVDEDDEYSGLAGMMYVELDAFYGPGF